MGAQGGTHEVAHFDVGRHSFDIFDHRAAGSLAQPASRSSAGAAGRQYRVTGIDMGIDIGSGPKPDPIKVTVVPGGVPTAGAVQGEGSWLTAGATARHIEHSLGDLAARSAGPPRVIQLEFEGTATLEAADRTLIEQVAEELDCNVDVMLPDEHAGG